MKLSPYRRWLLPVSLAIGAIAAFIPGCGTSNAEHSGGGASSSLHLGGGSAVGGESSGGANESAGRESSGGASQLVGTGGRESSGGASESVGTGGNDSSGGFNATGGSRSGTRLGSGGGEPTGGNTANGGSRFGTLPASGGYSASGGNLATGGGSRVLQSTTGGVNTAGGSKATGGSSTVNTGTTGGGSVCTSKTTWRSGENPNMRPGEACITCHSSNPGAPKFVVAGTVYPTIHEPADCNGSNSSGSAKIIITDAQGVEHSISVNSAGNFMLEGSAIPLPYHARIEASTGTRSMGASQSSGDCNSCHSENGTNGAPGRIMLP